MKLKNKSLDCAKSKAASGGNKPTAMQRKIKYRIALSHYSINKNGKSKFQHPQ